MESEDPRTVEAEGILENFLSNPPLPPAAGQMGRRLRSGGVKAHGQCFIFLPHLWIPPTPLGLCSVPGQ